MPKIEEAEEEARLRVKKRRNNLATTGREKVVGNLAGKFSSGGTTAKFSENNGNRRERRSERKGAGMD